jgi:DNA repair exonuclease SbcCD ATPase subunit
MKDDWSLLGTSNKQIMSTIFSKKPMDTPLVNQPRKIGPKLSVFEKYNMIKKKNQTLTSSTYAQFWKQTSTAQHRLLSTFDTEKGRMHMAFLQAQVPDLKVITDYKRETFEFQTKDVHPDDQMDLHRKTREMVFSTLENASTAASKLQVSLNNVQTQLELEKISSFAKDNRIKTLEELVLKIGYDPSNVKAVEEMLKKKNVDIASLRKQLKLSPTKDSQAKEIAETEGEKHEMIKLIMEQNAQLKEMEAKLEKLLKEKEQSKPMEVIPLSVVPLIGVSTTSATKIPSVTPLTALEKTVELEKSMEEMNLQETEISKLKKEVENLQEVKSSYQASYSKEKQTSDKLKQELQQLQKQTVAGKTLVEVKENVWMDITKSINEIWPMVQIMFEQNELVQRRKQSIEKIRGELGEMPVESTEIIKFLN